MRRTVAVGLAVLCLSAIPSSAAEFGGFASYWSTDDGDSSGGLGIRGTLPMTERILADMRWYWHFDLSDTPAYAIETTAITFGPTWVRSVGDTLDLYYGGAIALWWFEQEENEDNEENIFDIGLHGVVGVQKELTRKLSLMAEFQYTFVRPDLEVGQVGSGIEEEFTLDGPGVNVGIMYSF